MKTREGGIVGYNVQTAVDAEHHLIVAHEVTNEGVDRNLLATMSEKAREAIGTEGLECWLTAGTTRARRFWNAHAPALHRSCPKR